MAEPASLPVERDELRPVSLDDAIGTSWGMLARAVGEYDPVAVLGLFSGGNDSTILLHLLRDQLTAAVHINTGIGIEDTRQFVRDTCAGWDLDLIEEHPPPGSTYEEMVLKDGFPGPSAHLYMYRHLKERGLRAVQRRFITNGRKQRVIFCAGMRRAESSRRMRNTEEVHREGSVVWVSPLAHWTNVHMREYRERFDVPFNEVSAHLHMSGECLCGAFAKPGEIELIRLFYPATAERIEALEVQAREAGVHCKWGTRPPPAQIDGQMQFPGPLCSSCAVGVDGDEVIRNG